ncbi:MAG: DUF3800 domain-containing protein [Verrucomicrobiia bacterium]|jgi:hypothetical protein
MPDRFLYIFLDEAGNLDFSVNGTRYFLLSSVTKERPFHAYKELTELKYDLAELGANIEYFHAAEDVQATRNRVFDIIQRNLTGIRIDSLVVEKRKTGPALRAEERFYPEMLGYLLRYVIKAHDIRQFAEVIVFTDQIPVQRKRQAVKKAVKMTLANMLPTEVRYRILHHDSKSNCDLQIADYCNWAVYRKWDRSDERSYNLIRSAIQSEFEIFRNGTTLYY